MGVEMVEDLKRKPVELNLAAAKKRKSAQTGFIHYCYTSLPGDRQDTIPLYENFCYVLALLRSRLSEHVLEGKALLEKLIAFEVGGNFPIYIHDYPECKDRSLSLDLLPVLHWMLHDFRAVLGEGLSTQLNELIRRILFHAERIHAERPLSSAAWVKWKGYADPDALDSFAFTSAEGWADYLIALQMAESKGKNIEADLNRVRSHWHPHLHVFLGPQSQEKTEPKLTLFDLFFSHDMHSYANRALSDHPVHLQASLVHSMTPSVSDPSPGAFAQLITDDPRQGYVLFWGDKEAAHSLVCDHRNAAMQAQLSENGAVLDMTLPEGWEPTEQPELPLSLFCNLDDAHAITINGQKATAFQLTDAIGITSGQRRIQIRFSCIEGEGVFFGHLLRANRPTQQSCQGALRFEAYDWQISIRTIRRTSRCVLSVNLSYLSSEDSPGKN